ncbi:diguanylate cyclase [bacterium]|jgi:diguanylate cyclase (GGDEF)-like protein|nr:diguanylate cyclase [bacterium]
MRQRKEPQHLTSYRVLLVEQDPQQTDLYSGLIRQVADCQIDVVRHVESSFDWVTNLNYHLVVADTSTLSPTTHDEMKKPPHKLNTEVLSVLDRIKRASPLTSVILISSEASIEEAVAAIRMGAEDYFKKPCNPETFQLAVKRGLDKKLLFGENDSASSYLNLLNSCQSISAAMEQDRIFSIVQSYLTRELFSDHSAIYTVANGSPVRLGTENTGNEKVRKSRAVEEILDISLYATNPMPKMVETGEFYRFIDRGQLTPGLFVFRFKCAGDADYFCVCLSPERPNSLEAFEGQLKILRAQIEVTGKNIQQYLGVQHLVYVDDATGLYNTRYLNYILDREIAQALKSQSSFAILFIDADRFKSVNDTHGHLVGTKLLNELGEHLKKYVRETDTLFRYGGDEFVAVLSPCDLETARTVAERIRQSVEVKNFIEEEGLNIHFTVSIGVALFPQHASSKKDIIEAADKAMYGGKKTTKNRVIIADPMDPNQSNEHVVAPVETPGMKTVITPEPPAATAVADTTPAPPNKKKENRGA